jgi:hypothetical protein
MRTVIRTERTSSSESMTMDLDLRAGYNGGFFSVGGGAAFGMALKSSATSTLNSVEIYYSGQDRGTGIRTLSMADADAELINFASIAKIGTPLFCIIEKFDTHPDYIEAVTTEVTTTTTPAPKVKSFYDFLNDILYSKLVQLKVIM